MDGRWMKMEPVLMDVYHSQYRLMDGDGWWMPQISMEGILDKSSCFRAVSYNTLKTQNNSYKKTRKQNIS